jgi:hypothetical protein
VRPPANEQEARDVRTPADLLQRIQVLDIACVQCDRRGRYKVRTLVREIGLDRNLASSPAWRRTAVALSNRCDERRPDLSGGCFCRTAATRRDSVFSNPWPDRARRIWRCTLNRPFSTANHDRPRQTCGERGVPRFYARRWPSVSGHTLSRAPRARPPFRDSLTWPKPHTKTLPRA